MAGVTGVRLRPTAGGETREIACDGLFVAIGHDPNTCCSAACSRWTTTAT